VRLVRIRAAAALASVRPERVEDADGRKSLQRATEEFKRAMEARPDDWASYANLGSYDMESGDFNAAVEAYETALRLEPRVVAPMVNLSMAHANLQQNGKAEAWLRRALKTEPDNAAANFNLGLLLAEGDRLDEAEKALRLALKSDPQLAPAAYNLAVILGGKKDLAGAVQWCRKAHDLRPEELKYTQSLAFYLNESGAGDKAIAVLKKAIRETPTFVDGCGMLAGIYESRGQRMAAARVLRDALKQPGFPRQLRAEWQAHVEALEAKQER
jgi:tetratricopeptide (TPR) repeat protein